MIKVAAIDILCPLQPRIGFFFERQPFAADNDLVMPPRPGQAGSTLGPIKKMFEISDGLRHDV